MKTESTSVVSQLRRIIPEGKSIAFVSGNFNVIHPGHQRLLSFAAECGDYLVVAVNPDTTAGVMFPQAVRVDGMKALSFVNHVIGLEASLEDCIKELQPNVVVKGNEHQHKKNPEAEIVKSYGGKIVFGSGGTRYSSQDLLSKDKENIQSFDQPRDYFKRHDITQQKITDSIERLKGLRVTVIGDTIVDRYITCAAAGLSQEDPTIVVTPLESKDFIGGAGIVAGHAKGLGAEVNFYSTLGQDEVGSYVINQFSEQGIQTHFSLDKTRPTTLKERFRVDQKTLLRVNHVRQHSIDKDIYNKIFLDLEESISETDLVLFSDFNYGCIPQGMLDKIVKLCVKHNVKMTADSQSSSQTGDISRFEDMELITPTEREARLGVSDFNSGLVILCEKLQNKSRSKNVFITMANEGLIIHAPGPKGEMITDKLSALNSNPVDTAGAGDSLFVTASLSLVAKNDIWTSAYLGSLAAANQVSRVGNIPLQADELLKYSF